MAPESTIGHLFADELARVHRRIDDMERNIGEQKKAIEQYNENTKKIIEDALSKHEEREEERSLSRMQLLIKNQLYDFYSHVHGVNLRDENERNRYANDQRLKAVISNLVKESGRTILVKLLRLIIVLMAISLALAAANISVSSLLSFWLKG